MTYSIGHWLTGSCPEKGDWVGEMLGSFIGETIKGTGTGGLKKGCRIEGWEGTVCWSLA